MLQRHFSMYLRQAQARRFCGNDGSSYDCPWNYGYYSEGWKLQRCSSRPGQRPNTREYSATVSGGSYYIGYFSDIGTMDAIQSWSQEGVTGLSQEVGNLAVAAAPQYVDMEVDNRLHAAPMAPVMAPVPQDIILRREVWEEFIEAEIGRHMELVQAAQDDSAVAVRFPASWLELEVILRKMAYDVRTDDAWRTLGFAFLEGPSPSEQLILARARVGRMLCGLAHKAGWSDGCRAAADAAAARIAAAAAQCDEGLPELLKARRKLKPQLPLHKELGPIALALVKKEAPAGEKILTQWSDVLATGAADAATLQLSRSFATLAERGNARAWLDSRGPQPSYSVA